MSSIDTDARQGDWLPGRSYNEVARERDLLKAGIELALPQLDHVRRYIDHGGAKHEALRALERARRDLTVGVE
jgi:hypothetical protein